MERRRAKASASPNSLSGTIPSPSQALDRLKNLLLQNKILAALLIDGSHLNRIEQDFGKKVHRHILEKLKETVLGLRNEVIRREDVITSWRAGGNHFLIFPGKKEREKKFSISGLEGLSEKVHRILNQKMYRQASPYMKESPKISVGYAVVLDNPLVPTEQLIERLAEEAQTRARFQKMRDDIRNKGKLQELIIEEEILTVFQPIFNLHTRRVTGYEALSRGPIGTAYEDPFYLFNIAREAGLTFELDRFCRRKALTKVSELNSDIYVFINCLPTSINDPEFKGTYLRDFLKDIRRMPVPVVMEISERDAIEHYPIFREAVHAFPGLVFSIAINDAGASYSSLEAILEIQPRFLKLNISMVRGIDRNLLKQEMTKILVSFANKINALIIAEGIESLQELETLLSIGIPLGQGFFLGRPGPLGN